MNRFEELKNIICPKGDEALEGLITEFIFVEDKMSELKKLPFIMFDEKRPQRQKTTPAAKQYKELLQQYTNIYKIFARITGVDESDETSPLRMWVNAHIEKKNMDG